MATHDCQGLAIADSGHATLSHLQTKNAGNAQSKKYGSFLDYPFEIRAMVYEEFFAAEFHDSWEAEPDLESDDQNQDYEERETPLEERVTAHDKVSLLLANKAVLEEALPFFYRLHVFQYRLLERHQRAMSPANEISYAIQQAFQPIAKVRLVDCKPERETTFTCVYDVGHCIKYLTLACPNLKSLTTIISIGPSYIDLEEHAGLQLQQLWPRLNHLQLVVKSWALEYISPLLQLIAPGLKWSQYEIADDKGYIYDGRSSRRYSGWRTAFVIDRIHLEKGITVIKTDDKRQTESDEDASIGADDDISTDTGDGH